MAGVFLSYDRDDADRARRLATALEKAGHSVWWDLHVRSGAQFSKVIEEALKAADGVVVLWSVNSIESPWVRDEAAAGRDTGRLVPVTIDGTEPPMGFRQFQTIDLSRWTGRGKPHELRALLADVQALAAARTDSAEAETSATHHALSSASARSRPRIQIATVIAFAIIAVVSLYWFLPDRSSGPTTVSVASADNSPASQALARDLLVKLGALQASRVEAVRLLDQAGRGKQADLKITVSGSMESSHARASVALASIKEGAMLWSKDFDRPGTARSDLEEQIATSTARVLGCAIAESSGNSGRLSTDSRRTYLNACASAAEAGWDKRTVIPMLREVLKSSPRFRPAWALLLNCEADVVSLLASTDENVDSLRAQLRRDIEQARTVDKGMAEATLAEIEAEPHLSISRRAALADKAKDQDGENPSVLATRSQIMLATGRMNEGVNDANRAAQLDPLSPAASAALISTLAYSGQVERAHNALARAKGLWPEAQAISDAQFALELRGENFERALRNTDFAVSPVTLAYIAARKDPNDANVSAFIKAMQKQGMGTDDVVFAIQGLGEMDRMNEVFELVEKPKVALVLAANSYVLFRPWLANLRHDPRFMALAKRLGLVDYWHDSGMWPDFCSEPETPYNCQAEAAKLTGGKR
jgi:tetratricopeptide (TPR) repeat protein